MHVHDYDPIKETGENLEKGGTVKNEHAQTSVFITLVILTTL